jgi:hypothetical protein
MRKLVSKQRDGARVTKRYDPAATPYRRLLASGALDDARTTALRERHRALNPAQLKREIDAAVDLLWTLAEPAIGATPAARTAAS